MNPLKHLRNIPIFRNRIFHAVLMALFPPMICFFTEMGQSQDLSALFQFTLERAGVCLFSWIVTAAIFWVGTLLTKRAWTGGLSVAVLYMTIATVDYYKNQSNGSHFLFSDIQMLNSLSGMGDFAKLFFSPILFGCCLGAALLVFLLWCADIRLRKRFGLRWLSAGAIAWMTAFAVCAPEVFMPVCQAFGIDSSYTYNSFNEAERFSNNNLISNFVVSINQQVDSAVEEPEDYSQDTIDTLIDQRHEPESASVPTEEKPNVIVIMSETFADFRALDDDPALDEIYAPLDQILEAENTWSGKAIVPTFGGGTVKTEFELLFGLPVKSLNNAFIPHELLGDEEIHTTFPRLYSSLGYSTSYIHPYYSDFYDREDTYERYGFDRLLFLDDLTVSPRYHNGYVDDDTVYRQAEALMKETDKPDFIHITSMQNHMPYGTEEDGGDEYSCYLDGIEKSCTALSDFLGKLKHSDEPTIVLFTGDHFPYFTEDENIYQQCDIDSENCEILYEQSCFIWSNCPLDTTQFPEEQISAFYLPHLTYRAAGLPEEAFTGTMLEAIKETPVYSVAEESEKSDALLDMLTYDRVLGEGYSNTDNTGHQFVNVKKERLAS